MNGSFPGFRPYKDTGRFKFWCNKVLPTVYDDALSYYEVLTKVTDNLNDVIENLDTVEDNLDTLSDTVSTHSSDITTLKSDVAELQSGTEILKADVLQLLSDMSSVKPDVATLKTDVATLQTDYSHLYQDVVDAYGLIRNLETSVSTLQTNVTEMDETLTEAVNNIANLTTRLNTAFTAISSLQTQITTLSDRITTLSDRITALENIAMTYDDIQKLSFTPTAFIPKWGVVDSWVMFNTGANESVPVPNAPLENSSIAYVTATFDNSQGNHSPEVYFRVDDNTPMVETSDILYYAYVYSTTYEQFDIFFSPLWDTGVRIGVAHTHVNANRVAIIPITGTIISGSIAPGDKFRTLGIKFETLGTKDIKVAIIPYKINDMFTTLYNRVLMQEADSLSALEITVGRMQNLLLPIPPSTDGTWYLSYYKNNSTIGLSWVGPYPLEDEIKPEVTPTADGEYVAILRVQNGEYFYTWETSSSGVSDNYSTTEQEIGTWINGDKLYRKVVEINVTSGTSATTTFATNVKEVVKVESIKKVDTLYGTTASHYTGANNSSRSCMDWSIDLPDGIIAGNANLTISCGDNISNKEYIFIIYYTKLS